MASVAMVIASVEEGGLRLCSLFGFGGGVCNLFSVFVSLVCFSNDAGVCVITTCTYIYTVACI